MTWTPAQPRVDELDFSESADRTLQDLREELTGEPTPAGVAEEEALTELTEAELEGAAGVESPPGRID